MELKFLFVYVLFVIFEIGKSYLRSLRNICICFVLNMCNTNEKLCLLIKSFRWWNLDAGRLLIKFRWNILYLNNYAQLFRIVIEIYHSLEPPIAFKVMKFFLILDKFCDRNSIVLNRSNALWVLFPKNTREQ